MEVRLRRRGKRRHFLTRQRSGKHPRLKAPTGALIPAKGAGTWGLDAAKGATISDKKP